MIVLVVHGLSARGRLLRSWTRHVNLVFLCHACQNTWLKHLSQMAFGAYVIQVIPLTLLGRLYEPYKTRFPVVYFTMLGMAGVTTTFGLE